MIVDAPLRFPATCSYQVLGETETTAKLVRILQVMRPAANFRGYVAAEAERATDVDYLLVADLSVPGADALFARRGDDDLIVMPIPVDEVWSYWHFADRALDKIALVDGVPRIADDDILQIMEDLDRVSVDEETGELITRTDAYLYVKDDWLGPGFEHIKSVFGLIDEQQSFDNYKMLMTKPPRAHWSHYVSRVFDAVQYFEMLELDDCEVVLNGGVFGGDELPFLAAHLPETAQVHCFDPLGFEPMHPYVRPWVETAPQNFIEHRIALGEKDGQIQLDIEGNGQLAVNGQGGQPKQYPCRSIDSIVKQLGLTRVDLIKLDLEGSDTAALRGAIATMHHFRPRLALSIYHEISDFWYMPLVVNQVCPDYEFKFRSYSSERYETVLYATPRERLAETSIARPLSAAAAP